MLTEIASVHSFDIEDIFEIKNMMKNKMKFWLFVVFIIFLNIIILQISFEKKGNTSDLLYYGKRIPKFSIKDMEGNNISLKKNKYILLYFSKLDTNSDISTAKYLEKLYRKFNEHGLLIIGVTEKNKKSIEEIKNKENLNYPLTYYNDNFNLENGIINSIVNYQFHGIMLLDSSNVIRFVSSFYKQDDIRQITEKFLFDNIHYPPLEPKKLLKRGDIFPSFSIKNLKSGHFEQFPNGHETLAIVLTGRCPDCVISNFQITYHLLESRLINSSKNITLIFSSKFIENDILQNFNNINAKIVLAKENIPGIEDTFNSLFYFQDQILVIQLSEKGIITALDSLNDYIKKISNKLELE